MATDAIRQELHLRIGEHIVPNVLVQLHQKTCAPGAAGTKFKWCHSLGRSAAREARRHCCIRARRHRRVCTINLLEWGEQKAKIAKKGE